MMKDITIISLSMFQPQLFMTVKYNNNISKVAYISNKIYLYFLLYIHLYLSHSHVVAIVRFDWKKTKIRDDRL
jgi:hypothetical protein